MKNSIENKNVLEHVKISHEEAVIEVLQLLRKINELKREGKGVNNEKQHRK